MSQRKEWWNEGMYTDLKVVIQKLLAHCEPDDPEVFAFTGQLRLDAVNFHYSGTATRAEIDRIHNEVKHYETRPKLLAD